MKQPFRIDTDSLETINEFLVKSPNAVLDPLLEVVEKHGGVDRINEKARQNGALPSLLDRLKKKDSEYAEQLDWLQQQREAGRFIPMADYAAKLRPDRAAALDSSYQVTLEISALQYFPNMVRGPLQLPTLLSRRAKEIPYPVEEVLLDVIVF